MDIVNKIDWWPDVCLKKLMLASNSLREYHYDWFALLQSYISNFAIIISICDCGEVEG